MESLSKRIPAFVLVLQRTIWEPNCKLVGMWMQVKQEHNDQLDYSLHEVHPWKTSATLELHNGNTPLFHILP